MRKFRSGKKTGRALGIQGFPPSALASFAGESVWFRTARKRGADRIPMLPVRDRTPSGPTSAWEALPPGAGNGVLRADGRGNPRHKPDPGGRQPHA